MLVQVVNELAGSLSTKQTQKTVLLPSRAEKQNGENYFLAAMPDDFIIDRRSSSENNTAYSSLVSCSISVQ